VGPVLEKGWVLLTFRDKRPGGTPMSNAYEGYGWIRVKRYTRDTSKPLEEQYTELEQHHEKEMEFLIAEVRKLGSAHSSIGTDAAFAARALLINSLTDVDFMYHALTKTEKELVTKTQFTELVKWIHGRK
jgi:hypothetical protein